jgi:hypothetical protein
MAAMAAGRRLTAAVVVAAVARLPGDRSGPLILAVQADRATTAPLLLLLLLLLMWPVRRVNSLALQGLVAGLRQQQRQGLREQVISLPKLQVTMMPMQQR